MQPSRRGFRVALLAGVSVVALAAASPDASAADMASPPLLKKAPAPPPPQSTWSWWVEGGAFNTGGGSVGFPAFKPNWGGEGAIGFDWQAQPLWHVIGQFRYGTARALRRSSPLSPVPAPLTSVKTRICVKTTGWWTSASAAISASAIVMPCGPLAVISARRPRRSLLQALTAHTAARWCG
jgi:hypothetical protein